MKTFIYKCVKVFCEACIGALLAMSVINFVGCLNPRYAEVIHEYSK